MSDNYYGKTRIGLYIMVIIILLQSCDNADNYRKIKEIDKKIDVIIQHMNIEGDLQ